MVKITFEVNEDFIRENAKEEVVTAKMKAAEDNKAMKVLFDLIAFKQMKELIDEGKTEFTVTTDKLDEKSMNMWNNEIAEICLLGVFSEKDKEEKKEQ